MTTEEITAQRMGFSSFVPDYAGAILGTRMSRFVHDSGIDGLARIRGREIEILAVYAKKKGEGSLRDFIARMKGEFDRVEVLAIMSRDLLDILDRYGFGLGGRLDERGRLMLTKVWRAK